jgi:DNA-binding transcriptional LysR family regulator
VLSSDYFYDVLLAGALSRAALLAPQITFEVSSTGPEGSRAFQKGDIDLMITVPQYLMSDHPTESLFSDRDAVICWKHGKFAQGVSNQEFLEADFATAVFGEERRPTISEGYFRDHGISLRTAVQVPSFSALPGAVCGTDRLAVMHSGHARYFERHQPIAVHPLPIDGPGVSEVAQWHRLRRNDGGIQWLLSLLREQAAPLVEQSECKLLA